MCDDRGAMRQGCQGGGQGEAGQAETKRPCQHAASCHGCYFEQEAPPIIKKKLEPATCVLKISAQKGNPTTAATTNGKCFNDAASHMSQQQQQPQQQQSQPFVATLRAARQLPNGSWPATFYATHRQHEEQLQQQQLPMAEKDRTGTDGGTDVLLDDLAGGPLDFH